MSSSVSFVALGMRIAESVVESLTDTMATLETQHVPGRQFSVLELIHWKTLQRFLSCDSRYTQADYTCIAQSVTSRTYMRS